MGARDVSLYKRTTRAPVPEGAARHKRITRAVPLSDENPERPRDPSALTSTHAPESVAGISSSTLTTAQRDMLELRARPWVAQDEL